VQRKPCAVNLNHKTHFLHNPVTRSRRNTVVVLCMKALHVAKVTGATVLDHIVH
jgi:hypothetical protein